MELITNSMPFLILHWTVFNECVNISYFRLASDWFSKESKQPRSNWSLELGYNDGNTGLNMTYPHRAYGSGTQFSLQIILRAYRENRDHLCNGGSQGFKFMFSQPGESLHKLKRYYQVAFDQTTLFTVRPKLTIASHSIRKYKPETRGCYFNSERPLRFFKQYMQRSCEMECLTNFTLAQCGCVSFSMPSMMWINSIECQI